MDMDEYIAYKEKCNQIYQQIKKDFNITLDKIFSSELLTITNAIIKNDYYKDFGYKYDAEIYNHFMSDLVVDLVTTYKLNIVIPSYSHFNLDNLYDNYVDFDRVDHYYVKYNNEYYVIEIINNRYTGPYNEQYVIEPLKTNIFECARLANREDNANEFYETFVDVMEHYFVELKEK